MNIEAPLIIVDQDLADINGESLAISSVEKDDIGLITLQFTFIELLNIVSDSQYGGNPESDKARLKVIDEDQR